MTPDLIAFLKAWHDWATSGAPERKPFRRRFGLCGNAAIFGDYGLANAVTKLFGNAGFPFGGGDYHRRYSDATQHLCPKRLAWVRERLVEAGELVA